MGPPLGQHSTLKDFDEKYTGVGLADYLWYHSNFYLLVKSLYECKGKGFVGEFEKLYPKQRAAKLPPEAIAADLESLCGAGVSSWVDDLQRRSAR